MGGGCEDAGKRHELQMRDGMRAFTNKLLDLWTACLTKCACGVEHNSTECVAVVGVTMSAMVPPISMGFINAKQNAADENSSPSI